MAEENNPSASSTNSGTPPQGQGPEFTIQKLYIKDLSFEAPSAPDIFLKEWKGETNLQLNTKTRTLNEQDGVYEVELGLTVTTTSQSETAYLVEVKQAGVFVARGFSPEQKGHLFGAYCPNILFPFAREVVADMVLKGGFPQVLLQPINFDALYAQHQQKQQGAPSDAASPCRPGVRLTRCRSSPGPRTALTGDGHAARDRPHTPGRRPRLRFMGNGTGPAGRAPASGRGPVGPRSRAGRTARTATGERSVPARGRLPRVAACRRRPRPGGHRSGLDPGCGADRRFSRDPALDRPADPAGPAHRLGHQGAGDGDRRLAPRGS
ncbi:Protein export cytoplasm chaperone protein (SecB, maintains protein to be exported in unfolded state) [Thioalkalivibrio nitratireducens DSM 14787]|uniref:Protein-export protein SecB n=1 Tax=Thioalkalivibrio nitratireducens (strain DSM 14787 / UNIQEM 213 / ALEN2) TaxID=1255043 RepID=L0E2D0_THIND|nr:Protein export cytoplasm chaperone protein (SecB, maintains protein to be exported in unfolded state) [Thioalkalivibrio nitratireducens DSM 14787]